MIDAAMKPETDRLLELIAGLCRELRPGQPAPALTLNSELERDAELDSLARAERKHAVGTGTIEQRLEHQSGSDPRGLDLVEHRARDAGARQ